MGDIETRILEVFKKEPNKKFGTGEIVKELFKKKYYKIKKGLESREKEKVINAKRKKATLHRRVLYHLNKLVEDDILEVHGVRGKNEKLFKIALEEGKVVIERDSKKIVISKPSKTDLFSEKYKNNDSVALYEADTWINKLNAVLVEGRCYTNLAELERVIEKVQVHVNDALGINSFEKVIEDNSLESLTRFINYIGEEMFDYGKRLTLIIDLKELEKSQKAESFIRDYTTINPENIRVVIETDRKEVKKHESFFKTVIQEFYDAKKKINIKNSSLHPPPYVIGESGTYTFRPEEWALQEKGENQNPIHAVVTSSAVIDVNDFFKKGNASDFREITEKIAKTLFKSEVERRKHQNTYYSELLDLLDEPASFYNYSRSYIRFWNYDWEGSKEYYLPDLLNSVKKELNEFSKSQETVYRSCGMPLRFSIGLSSAFLKLDSDFLSERRYKKSTYTSISSLQEGKLKEFILFREKLFKIFTGGDRIRLFRKGSPDPREIMREITFVLSSYDIPFFTYDFRGMSGDVKLTSFLNR